jgi:mannonate dehydratase
MNVLNIACWLIGAALLLILCFVFVIPFLAGRTHHAHSIKLSAKATALVHKAYQDIPFWVDYHLHLVALAGDSTGWVNPAMQSLWHPLQRLRFEFYSRAAGVKQRKNADETYVSRLHELTSELPPGKIYLLAMDKHYNKAGVAIKQKSPFYVSNEYLWQISKNSKIFSPIVSIHPYKKEALNELRSWHQKGVRYIKWLPNSMGIDPSNPQLKAYYEIVKELDMVILTHTGIEEAVVLKEGQEFGNPQLLRFPLEMGVKMIMAHVASLGKCIDLESPDHKRIYCFELSIRMLEEPRYRTLLFADISGITLINRQIHVLKTLLARQDLHDRLIYGSDYPICAVNILVQTWTFQKHGLISKEEAKLLKEIYKKNPLVFDFVLKRTLKLPGSAIGFPTRVFGPHPLLPQ